jgi:hypothetical protein
MKQLFTDEFRAAILNSDISRYKIAKATGISESILSRFCRGESGMSNAFMDLIADHLGLHVVAKRPRKTRRAKPKGKR